MAPAAGAFARLFMRAERPEPILVHFFTESEMCAALMREFTLVDPSGA